MTVVNVTPKSIGTQWNGSNVTEIRQVVRATVGAVNDAIIRDGELYLTSTTNSELQLLVPIGHWIVSTDPYNPITPEDFARRYNVGP